MKLEDVVTDNFIDQEINLTSVTEKVTKLDTKSLKIPKQRKSFLINFNSDIILPAIAIGCILGAFLFYFQGLQPLILRNYSETASKKVVDLKSRYSEQVSPISSTQNTFDSYFQDYSDKVCSQQELYKNKTADQEKNDRLKLSLVPDSSFKNLSNSGIFYNSEIQTTYQQYFTDYINSLDAWNASVNNLSAIPNFLEFRNLWVSSCQKIEESKGDLATLKDICSNLKTGLLSYEGLKTTQFWDQVSGGVTVSMNKCDEVINLNSKSKLLTNYGQWRLEWLTGFDRIVQARPVWNEVNSKINNTSENFLNSATVTINKFNSIVQERQQFINLWYILDFKVGK